MSKPKLIPFEVSWKISGASPLLRLAIAENEAAEVEFQALLRNGSEKHNHMVKLRFELPVWSKTTPATTEEAGEAILEQYDWTLVKPGRNTVIAEYQQEFERLWLETGLCPDPRVYEILDSPWVSNVDTGYESYKHYMILGFYIMIEILGNKWTCEVGERIDWGRSR